MATIAIFIIFILLAGFGMADDRGDWPNFHTPAFILSVLVGGFTVLIIFFGVFSGDPMIIEDGEYILVPISIAEREGYIVECYGNKDGVVVSRLINIETKNGLIVPISISGVNKIEIIEDGQCIFESKNKIKGNFWLTFTTREYAESIKIHIPSGSLIMRHSKGA